MTLSSWVIPPVCNVASMIEDAPWSAGLWMIAMSAGYDTRRKKLVDERYHSKYGLPWNPMLAHWGSRLTTCLVFDCGIAKWLHAKCCPLYEVYMRFKLEKILTFKSQVTDTWYFIIKMHLRAHALYSMVDGFRQGIFWLVGKKKIKNKICLQVHVGGKKKRKWKFHWFN